jgi:hypothetical protein
MRQWIQIVEQKEANKDAFWVAFESENERNWWIKLKKNGKRAKMITIKVNTRENWYLGIGKVLIRSLFAGIFVFLSTYEIR